MVKRLRFVLLPLVVVCFLLVGCFTVLGQTTEPKLISMGGSGWSLTVDKQPLSVDVKSVASVSAAKDMQQAQELSLVLNSLDECKSGVVEFKVDTVGLLCYKQLPLTEQEIKDGAVRPENVVNSYACFDGSGRKVLHIYASRLIDAKGNSVWVDQNLTKGILTVYLNMSWLGGAVFPVVLDPSFGLTSIGGSEQWTAGNAAIGSNFTLTENAEPFSMLLYGRCTNVDTHYNVSCAIYNATDPAAKVFITEDYHLESTTNGWMNISLVSSSMITAGDYMLFFNEKAVGSTSEFAYFYDSATGKGYNKNLAYNYPTSWTSTISQDWLADRICSIYVNYTAYAEPTPSPSVTASPTPTPAVSGSVLDMNWLVFAFVVFGAVLCIIPARIFVVRVVVGMFGIVLAVTQLQNSALWFYPWSLVLWLFMSVCVLYSIWARTD